MKQQWLLKQELENNIDRTSLFVIDNGSRLLQREKAILRKQACLQLLSSLLNLVNNLYITVLMVEQCCNNIVFMTEQPC